MLYQYPYLFFVNRYAIAMNPMAITMMIIRERAIEPPSIGNSIPFDSAWREMYPSVQSVDGVDEDPCVIRSL